MPNCVCYQNVYTLEVFQPLLCLLTLGNELGQPISRAMHVETHNAFVTVEMFHKFIGFANIKLPNF